MTIKIVTVDYENEKQLADLVMLLDQYACDPMGGSEPLSAQTKANLPAALRQRDFVFSIIVYVDDQPAGLANCIESFSTFGCKPVINIHDLTVNPEFRGQGVSQALLGAVEQVANEKGAARITLEVLSGNKVAINAYRKFWF